MKIINKEENTNIGDEITTETNPVNKIKNNTNDTNDNTSTFNNINLEGKQNLKIIFLKAFMVISIL